MFRLAIIWCALVGTAVASDAQSLRRFEATGVEMAVPIRLVLYAKDKKIANEASEAALAEFRRLNAIFSDYDAQSESRRLCNKANVGSPEKVSDDLFKVLSASKKISTQSGGAFDITVGPLSRLWRRAIRRGELPPPNRLSDARNRVGHQFVQLDPRHKTVTLLKQDMRLDFGGIAKGYALDAAMDVLHRHGIRRALVEAGGDMRLGDPPPDKKGWRIGIARVDDRSKPKYFVTLDNVGIATSGDAWQFVEIDGRRYSHIVDPRSGLGLTDHSSVTVIAPDAMTADALASAVSVLGPAKGLKLIEQFPKSGVLIVRAPDGQRKVHASERMRQILKSSL